MQVGWNARTTQNWLAVLVMFAGMTSADEPSTQPNQEDQTLRCVTMIDDQEGLAAGDQGVLLHTVNGGKTWQRVRSGTLGSITSVNVLDTLNMYLCSRENIPCNPATRGRVVRTTDGGLSWEHVDRIHLPGLRKIAFFDQKIGFAIGEATDPQPTGLFFTNTGGKSWYPFQGVRFPGWMDACFLDPELGFLVGLDRTFGRFERGKLSPVKGVGKPNTAWRAIATNKQVVCAVGESGQIAVSADRGITWDTPKLPVPASILDLWDFHTVCMHGNSIWVGGRPGSVVLYSPDAGKTWTTQRTKSALRLKRCHSARIKLDVPSARWVPFRPLPTAARHGRLYVRVPIGRRSSGSTLTLRIFHFQWSRRHGLNDGLQSVAVSLCQFDLSEDEPNVTNRSARFVEAFRAVGGTHSETVGRFPLPQERFVDDPAVVKKRWAKRLMKLIPELNPELDAQGNRREMSSKEYDELFNQKLPKAVAEVERRLSAEIMLALRIWQPTVVVTDAYQGSPGSVGIENLVSAACAQAVQSASDTKQCAEQLEFFGLIPVSPDRLYSNTTRSKAALAHQADEISEAAGRRYVDLAEQAMLTMLPTFESAEEVARFDLLAATSQVSQAKSMTDGLEQSIDKFARRHIQAITQKTLDENKLSSEMKRKVLQAQDGGNDAQLLKDLPNMLSADKLNMYDAGITLFRLAKRFGEQGKWTYAYPTYEHMLREYPEHPLAGEACRMMLAIRTSSEIRRQIASLKEESNKDEVVQMVGTAARALQQHTGDPNDPRFKNPNSFAFWNQSAIEMGDRLKVLSPLCWADPRVQLTLAAANRRLGHRETWQEHTGVVYEMDAESAWATIVRNERAHFEGNIGQRVVDKQNPDRVMKVFNVNEPRRIGWSTEIATPPKLDGVLEESCWKGGKQHTLAGMDVVLETPYQTNIMLRHDAKYLYIGADCSYPSADHKRKPVERRGHDADLSRSDRVEILLDLDRDYTTYYRFAISQVGLTAEECAGDRNWNPRWAVATSQSDIGWQAEVAIPLDELVHRQDLVNEPWAFNLMRVVPGVGTLGWTTPVGAKIRPEGFTHLSFINRHSDEQARKQLQNKLHGEKQSRTGN